MKRTLRTIAVTAVLALASFGLTGCGDTEDDCDDAAGTTTSDYQPAAYEQPMEGRSGGSGGGRGGGSRSGSGKSKSGGKSKNGSSGSSGSTHGGSTHRDHDDCEDDD